MAELSDFQKIPKTDSFNDLLSGMRYFSYSRWAGFVIPDFSEDDECFDSKLLDEFKFYTDIKISGQKDLQSLFYMSISEAAADNVKKLFAGIDLSLCKKCENPSSFIDLIINVKLKCESQTEIFPVLAIDSNLENNLYLAETFIENKKFAGIILSGEKIFSFDEKTKIYDKILASARKCGLKTEINCVHAQNSDGVNFALTTFKPDFIKDVPESVFDEKIFDFVKQTEICAEFTPYVPSCLETEKLKKYKFMRRLFDSGIKIRLCTGSLLLLKKSVSEFAVDLCNSGIFSEDEVKSFFEI